MRSIALLAAALSPCMFAAGPAWATLQPDDRLLTVETGRVLAEGQHSIALGLVIFGTTLSYNGALGGGELQASLGTAWAGSGTGTGLAANLGLGWKHPIGRIVGFDAALRAFAGYQGSSGITIAMPFTGQVGPGDLTIAPRAVVGYLPVGVPTAPRWVAGLELGYALPIVPGLELLAETFLSTGTMPSWGSWVPPYTLGLRWTTSPNLTWRANLGLMEENAYATSYMAESAAVPLALSGEYRF